MPKRLSRLKERMRGSSRRFFSRSAAGWHDRINAARRKAAGEQPVIGVNTLVEPSEPPPLPIHKVDPAVEARQIGRLKEVRRNDRLVYCRTCGGRCGLPFMTMLRWNPWPWPTSALQWELARMSR